MKSLKIYPYRMGSKSVRALANALSCKVLRRENSKYKPKEGDVIINWGSKESLVGSVAKVLNISTLGVSNKLQFFSIQQNEEWLPKFWTNKEDIPENEYPIVCRTILNGHSGAGIVIADTPADLVDAPLYVKYIKKQQEFRIHVGKKPFIGEEEIYAIISEQQKVRRSGSEPLDWRVRSHSNGFVFKRQGIDVPLVARSAAISCLTATGLDFGAVDVIVTKSGKAYVLEVNTAPGLEGQTVEDYANFFRNFCDA